MQFCGRFGNKLGVSGRSVQVQGVERVSSLGDLEAMWEALQFCPYFLHGVSIVVRLFFDESFGKVFDFRARVCAISLQEEICQVALLCCPHFGWGKLRRVAHVSADGP